MLAGGTSSGTGQCCVSTSSPNTRKNVRLSRGAQHVQEGAVLVVEADLAPHLQPDDGAADERALWLVAAVDRAAPRALRAPVGLALPVHHVDRRAPLHLPILGDKGAHHAH